MRLNMKSLTALAVIFLVAAFTGCGGGGGGSSSGSVTGGTTGTLALSLTDSSDNYKAVYVTIERVDVHRGGEEIGTESWQIVATPGRTYNLLELVDGVMETLGVSELEAGLYTQMRLIIGSAPDGELNILGNRHPYANYVILADTEETHELFVPSGMQTGIKLVREFMINENEVTELILDFDAAKSVVQAGKSGKWLLKPTIKVIGTDTSSSIIKGTVVDGAGEPLAGVLVSAQVYDDLAEDPAKKVRIETSTLTNEDGQFSLWVQPGMYNVVAYKVGYTYATACGVTTVPGEIKQLPDPIVLATSNFGTVGGLVTVESEGSALISFRTTGCSVQIEVKSLTVDDGGTYSQILPVAPPAGPYDVVASSEGMTTVEYSGVAVDAGGTTPLDITISPAP